MRIFVQLQRFNELEERIKEIVNEYEAVAKENRELKELLEQKKEEVERSRATIQSLEEERKTVRDKIDSLLSLLGGIQIP